MSIKLIAEVSYNHMGDMNLAENMIEQAAVIGADFVKFQTWRVKNLRPGPWDNDGRREIYKQAELNKDQYVNLIDCCTNNGIQFLTSCFSVKDLKFVYEELGINNYIKIPSPESSDHEIMSVATDLFSNIFMSTGASYTHEYFSWISHYKITPLHCVSSYPMKSSDFNINKFNIIKQTSKALRKEFGYSGHYPGIEDAILAISMGATVIEKHFTLDKDAPGRDNKFALLPGELRKICEYADFYNSSTTETSISEILDSEMEYRENHKGRWSG